MSNTKKQVIQESNWQCYYCGCTIDENTEFKHDSAVVNLYIPKSRGGSRVRANLVASCYICSSYIKKGMDTTALSLAEVRKRINLERRRTGFAYNLDYANSNCDEVIILTKPAGSPAILAKEEPVGYTNPATRNNPVTSSIQAERAARAAQVKAFMDSKFPQPKHSLPEAEVEDQDEVEEQARLDAIRKDLGSRSLS